MHEKFSIPEADSAKWTKQEIEEGIAEYLKLPYLKAEITPDLVDSFNESQAENPLRKENLEKHIEGFIETNLETLLPLLISQEQDHSTLIQKLGLSNKDIGLLGANYYIREQNGKKAIFRSDENYPEGIELSQYEISQTDLLALKYAKENIRVDSQRELGKFGGKNPHRFYFDSEHRYLCSNDFGMRVWDQENKTMTEGNTTDLQPFINTIKQQIERIRENVTLFTQDDIGKLQTEMFEEARKSEGAQSVDYATIQKHAEKIVLEQTFKRFDANPRDLDIVLRAISPRKVSDQLHFNYEKIAKRYDLLSDDPVKDYEDFESNSLRLEKLLRTPTDQEKEGASVDYVYSDFYRKPVIVSGRLNKESVINGARSGVKDVLARRAVETDPTIKECFDRFRAKRGENSPYFYPDHQIYDFIKKVGLENVEKILATDDRNISEQMQGLQLLNEMRYDITRFEPEQLKKQLHQAYTLQRTGLWKYLADRDVEESAKKKISVRKSRDHFYEGKRMYWLAKQVWMSNPNKAENDRFYHNDSYINWDRYDLSKADVSEEKLNEYLAKQKNLIVALLGQGVENRSYNDDQKDQGKSATLGLIIQALEQGNDIRGVALANDKQRYLEGIIAGKVQNDLEFATMDWPTEWQGAISVEEIALYYEYASDYVLLDPNGLTKYASWRATEEGKTWTETFKETPTKKSDMDFRICLGSQTEEIRGWYRGAAEHVGNSVMQSYLLRFNATRDGSGKIANWHDVLLWSPNIKKLEAGEAKSILSSIETMDDNQEFTQLLPRYDKNRDPLLASGPIPSLRELKKRVLGIESNIDLTKFTPEVIEITSAPGFNLAALESMSDRSNFKDLVDGKLDKEQPFEPRMRTFVGRSLTEALREGLGSQKQKIRGTAKDPKGLFYALNQLVKDRLVGEKKMTTLDLINSVPADLEEDLIDILREQGVDVGPIVEAQIHAKSDPDGWVCGNYTDCCMPFGASNNDDYMFNPSTQYFTIKYNGRIVAQSVVADSKNNETNEDVVILDNIEVANNYKHLSPLLANVYQTFWTEYTSKPVKVGTGYSDLIPPGGKLEQNHYRSKTPLYYSDATGSQIYDLPKIRGIESMDQITTFANLSERDTELIAKMEAEAYPEGMAQGKAHIADILQKQRDLEVPGAASSFVVRQGREAAGYLLVLPEESQVNSGENAAHIYDMVVLPKFRGSTVAKKMMERVLEIASAYNVSIEAEARASTSYALLMNERVRRWFETKGFYLTKNEKLPEYLAGEDFYFVRFENKQNI